ncbi:MAG: hypothetical protein ACRDWI_19275 [Jiangellaceae bacterium]
MGNLWFASSWVALASFSLANGWVILSSGSLPRWLGWWALAAGLGLLAGRAVWTTPVWLVGCSLFWIWVIAVSIMLLRRRSGAAQPLSPPARG